MDKCDLQRGFSSCHCWALSAVDSVKGSTFFLIYSPLWGCAGDRVKMVVKVHCGTVLGAKLPPCWKCVPQNSPTMHFDNHVDPVSRATSKWRIRSLQLTRLGDSVPGSLYRAHSLFEGKTGDILIAFMTLFRITFMTLFFCSKRLGLVRIILSNTLWLEIVTNISLQIIAENIKKKCTFVVSFKTSPWKCEITL